MNRNCTNKAQPKPRLMETRTINYFGLVSVVPLFIDLESPLTLCPL